MKYRILTCPLHPQEITFGLRGPVEIELSLRLATVAGRRHANPLY